MDRRDFLAGITAATTTMILGSERAFAQEDPLNKLLSELSSDPSLVENSWLYREPSVSRGVGHGTPSKRKLIKPVTDMIIAFEVASPTVYEARYRRPIWPKGESGVTIGVGYDLRFANKHYIDRDWPKLSQADRNLLYSVAGFGGSKANRSLTSVRDVEIHWNMAEEQFLNFLPYPTDETEKVFPNCGELSDLSFGALVSLVYNRGSSVSRNSKRRVEMYEIQQMMKNRTFDDIPDRIRSMKRLWKNDPNARGLLIRRDAEAILFEKGRRSPG
ncbi:hypothetical protein [Rhizobium sp. 768_B6_N1_8]|uniref:hypothetical protein n=1 Tax=unclassified Rhizobium TaxID=2613769 RepID=UPI003F26B1E5